MIDFDALVLAPCMAVLGQRIVVLPTVSQPNAPPFVARGVFAQKPVQVPLDDGTFYSTVQPTMGIRLADYPVPPKQGDSVMIGGTDLAPSLGSTLQAAPSLTTIGGTNYFVGNIVHDGQGGADMELRRTDPRSEPIP